MSFFRAIRDLWNDWIGIVSALALAGAVIILSVAGYYNHTYQNVEIGDGIEVRVAGHCWYLKDDPKAGGKNQFFASNELGFSDNMSMEPRFTLINTSAEPREVNVRSLSAWKVPIAGKVYLEPGQRFEFQIQAQHQHWYCWINPKPSRKEI